MMRIHLDAANTEVVNISHICFIRFLASLYCSCSVCVCVECCQWITCVILDSICKSTEVSKVAVTLHRRFIASRTACDAPLEQ